MSDNNHLIINKNINSSNWGMSTLYGDNYFSPKDIDINNKPSCIYSLNIYMDYGIIYYTREFKKIFLIISNVFPLFRFILYIFKCFTKHVKMSVIKSRLVRLIFENRAMPKTSIFQCRRLNQLIDEKNKTNYLSKNNDIKEIISSQNDEPPPSKNKRICKLNEKEKDNDNDKKCNNKSSLMNSNISLNNDNLINILNRKKC